MQAALITYLQAAPNTAEAPGETTAAGHAGSGMRINSASRSGINDTLFTTILQQGITIDTALGLGGGDMTLLTAADVNGEADEGAAADACSLLMQLVVLNSAAQTVDGGQETPGEEGRLGMISAVSESPGASACARPEDLEAAVTGILNRGDTASEMLGAPAAGAATENNERAPGLPEGKPSAVPFDEVLDGIAGALKSELNRSGAAQDAPAASTDTAAITGNAAAEQSAVPAASENGSTPAEGRTEGTHGSAASAPGAELSERENAVVPPVAGKTDGNDGGRAPNGPGSRDKNNDAAAAGGGVNAALPDTGAKSAPVAEKAAAVERALSRFADDIISVRGGSREIRIVLEPESLGVVTISVVKNENGISAKIKSEDREIAAIISDQVQRLVSSMESKGITVNDIDVAYSQMEQNAGFTRQGFSQARDESTTGSALPADRDSGDDTTYPEIWQTLYDGGAAGDTTVDYRI